MRQVLSGREELVPLDLAREAIAGRRVTIARLQALIERRDQRRERQPAQSVRGRERDVIGGIGGDDLIEQRRARGRLRDLEDQARARALVALGAIRALQRREVDAGWRRYRRRVVGADA